MGERLYWEKFWWGAWLADTKLQAAPPDVRGIWMNFLCHMGLSSPRGRISGTKAELARLAGCTIKQLDKFIAYNSRLNFCEIKICPPDVPGCPPPVPHLSPKFPANVPEISITNRRMWRQEKNKEKERLKKKRQRTKSQCPGVVPPSVPPSVPSLSPTEVRGKEVRGNKNPPISPLRENILHLWTQVTGRVLTPAQLPEIHTLMEKHGDGRVVEGIRTMARHNGRTISFLEKILKGRSIPLTRKASGKNTGTRKETMNESLKSWILVEEPEDEYEPDNYGVGDTED